MRKEERRGEGGERWLWILRFCLPESGLCCETNSLFGTTACTAAPYHLLTLGISLTRDGSDSSTRHTPPGN